MIYEPTINFELEQFRNAFQYVNLAEDKAFERFINYNLLLQFQPDAFNADAELLEAISVGGYDDWGLDGIAIRINNSFISSSSELESWINNKKEKLSIEYIFVQSKNKPNTDCGELLKFINGIREFFNDDTSLPKNESIDTWYQIRKIISSKDFIKHLKELPRVRCYFVSTSNDLADQHKSGYISTFVNEMQKNFTSFSFDQYGASEIVKIIKQNKSDEPLCIPENGIINFSRVDGIKNACVVLCKAIDLITALDTKEGIIKKSIFADNVRDFQGMNNVNTEISFTIKEEPNKFVLFNNGITIIGTNFIEQSKILSIDNPQIVNGCQTCNVLYNAWKAGIDISDINLIIKVISTEDTTLANDVVKGNNRQSIVYEEAFETTLPFHKDFEKFVNDFCNIRKFPMRIYYERRSKQYAMSPTIEPYQKFNLKNLIQYSVAVLLEEPHNAHLHESLLVRKYKDKIFQKGESYTPYFAVAYAFLKLEKYLKDNQEARLYHTYKSHLLLIYTLIVAGGKPNRKDQSAADEYAEKLLTNLCDSEKYEEAIDKAKNVLNECKTIWIKDCQQSPYAIKDVPDFTTLIVKKMKNQYFEWFVNKLSKTHNTMPIPSQNRTNNSKRSRNQK